MYFAYAERKKFLVVKMKNQQLLNISILVIFFACSFSSTSGVSAVTYYPFSVKIGDKIDYHVDILQNGTNKGPINVFGLNLTQGDNFQIEIYTGVAKSTYYLGSDYTIKFVKGDKESNSVSGSSYLYTSNETFWQLYKNTTQDIGGQVYELTRLNNSITYSWTSNADNFVKIEFNPSDGLVKSYERADTTGNYNYTHFKFTKGSGGLFNDVPLLSNVPSFDIPISLFSLFVGAIISINIKKKIR